MIAARSLWRRTGTLPLAAIALIWAGMIIGVSMLATPVKFSAPSLTLPVALDVGRVTFHLFARVEWALAVALVIAGLAAQWRLSWLSIGFVVVVIALQALWLLPALGVRTTAVISGVTPPPSALHTWYVAAEAAKILTLITIGIGAMRRGAKPTGARSS